MQFVSIRNPTLLVLIASLFWPAYLQSQSNPTTSAAGPLVGRVVKGGAPFGGAEVTLHQVTPQQSGAIASRAVGSDGSFQFSLPPADTGQFNVFFVTVDHLGTRYFGPAVHAGELPPNYMVQVFDTTSVALPGTIRVARRDVILLPEADGTWSGNELVRMVNTGDRTLVPATGVPSLEFALPEGATDVEVTEGDAATSELQVMGDRALFTGSLIPGTRELFVRYRFPGDRKQVALRTLGTTDTFNVYIPEDVAGAEVTGLGMTEVVPIEEQRFVKHGAMNVPNGHQILVALAEQGPPVSPVAAGLVATLVVLAGGAFLAFRRNDPLVRPAPVQSAPRGKGRKES